jgi:micrococcal nuclease
MHSRCACSVTVRKRRSCYNVARLRALTILLPMPRRLIVFAVLLAVCVGLGPTVAAQFEGTRLAGVVTHVADGDTLDVRAGGRTYTVRLDGIDAPEGGQAFSDRARQQLRVLAFSQPATVRVQTTDRYGRLVGRVIVDGRDLSEEMLKAGLAWHFVRYSSDGRLHALEQQARQQRAGLWADRSSIPPWEFRRERAARRSPIAPSSSARRPPSAGPHSSPSPVGVPAAGPFHGNVSSRVYHAAGCRDYNCRHCAQVFATRQAAEAAGYRPHKECVLGRH